MKITRLVPLFVAAFLLGGLAARGEDARDAKGAQPQQRQQLEMALIVPSMGYDRMPYVPKEDHNGTLMLHMQVVLHNLTDRPLVVRDFPDEFGPAIEVKAPDGKSWVRLGGSAGPRGAFTWPVRTIAPKGREVLDVYFDNHVSGKPEGIFNGRVMLRAVFSEKEGIKKLGVWEGDAVSAPAVCVIQ